MARLAPDREVPGADPKERESNMKNPDKGKRRVRKPFVKPELRKGEGSLKSRTAGLGGHKGKVGFHGSGSWPVPGGGGMDGGS